MHRAGGKPGAGLRESVHGLAWISPWLAGFIAFLLVPILLSFYYSLNDYSLLESPVFIGLENYRELTRDPLAARAVLNTVQYAIFSVAGTTLLSIAIAILLETPLRAAGLVRAIVFAPALVPIIASCMSWLWLFNNELGLINAALRLVHLPAPDWLGSTELAMPSLIIMSFWVIGSPVIIYSAALKDVPAALYEAADLDGVSTWGRFRHVTLPMISPAVLFNMVMSVIWSLQVFAPPLVMTKGGPANSTLVYSVYVYMNAFLYGRMGYACAMAWVQVIATLLLTGVLLFLARRLVYARSA
ncbi:MAG TPA: sugar ABC transporter permease [Phycisphaerales bacterium]|nr:sugar ABC transporter permease [Phycisphaerales bacterium]